MNKNDIPTYRYILFYGGYVLIGLGVIMFLSAFISVLGIRNMNFIGNGGRGPSIANSFIGIIFIGLGGFLNSIGRAGMAGSGVILNPGKARQDLKPYSRQFGGMAKDAYEEFKNDNNGTVKVRCPNCRALNDEDTKYCKECGTKL